MQRMIVLSEAFLKEILIIAGFNNEISNKCQPFVDVINGYFLFVLLLCSFRNAVIISCGSRVDV